MVSVTVLYEVVSFGNRYSTFRDDLVVSFSRVDILNNISLHEDVCESLFRKVDNQLPNDDVSHISSKDTECR